MAPLGAIVIIVAATCDKLSRVIL